MPVLQRLTRLLSASHFVPQETIDQENELTELMAHLREIALRNEQARALLKRVIERNDRARSNGQ
jgi:hypothetical protein